VHRCARTTRSFADISTLFTPLLTRRRGGPAGAVIEMHVPPDQARGVTRRRGELAGATANRPAR